MREEKSVVVIGAGLAGCEAAWQLAIRGIRVDLFEMRPHKMTEAHKTGGCAELVCSNSLGSLAPNVASTILKSELRKLGAFVLAVAEGCAVPAGASLAVDRDRFSETITEKLQAQANIKFHREEILEIPKNRVVIVATGPLTSKALSKQVAELVGAKSLFFYDAISPIVLTESLDLEKMFYASRYDKGDPDFLNIPLSEEKYDEFIKDLLAAEVVLPHDFEEGKYFESCLPIETIAGRGRLTLAFGPMKPVGLFPPSGEKPFAVIQLRTENRYRSAYNLVGFQTKMKYPDQQRVFRKLPGLENAEFTRLGSIHRNTYVDSPRVLKPTLQLRTDEQVFIAGQLTGTEGYLESSATGLLAGYNAFCQVSNLDPVILPQKTMLGGLVGAITDSERTNFQPMNANMGILPPTEIRIKNKQERRAELANRCESELEKWREDSFISAEDLKGRYSHVLEPRPGVDAHP